MYITFNFLFVRDNYEDDDYEGVYSVIDNDLPNTAKNKQWPINMNNAVDENVAPNEQINQIYGTLTPT